MDETQRAAAAEQLLRAHESGNPISPLSESYPRMTLEDSYAIQSILIERWTAQGRQIRGYKVGLTSEAMQRQLGVSEPDYGFLLDGMLEPSGRVVDVGRFISPRIEPEIAVMLGADLRGPGITAEDVAAATEYVMGSLEIIDSRIEGWRIQLADTIADNASSAAVVVGESRLTLDEFDLLNTQITVSRNGQVAGTGTGTDVLGSPLNAIAWLANKLAEFDVTLEAGRLVLPGSVCAAIAVESSDSISADFGPLGVVDVSFNEAK